METQFERQQRLEFERRQQLRQIAPKQPIQKNNEFWNDWNRAGQILGEMQIDAQNLV